MKRDWEQALKNAQANIKRRRAFDLEKKIDPIGVSQESRLRKLAGLSYDEDLIISRHSESYGILPKEPPPPKARDIPPISKKPKQPRDFTKLKKVLPTIAAIAITLLITTVLYIAISH